MKTKTLNLDKLLINCVDKNNTTIVKPINSKKDVSVGKNRKIGRPRKVVTNEEVRAFVLENGSKMTNDKMAKKLRVPLRRIGACVAHIKRGKLVKKNFFVADQRPKEIVKKVKKEKVAKDKYIIGKYKNHDGENKHLARNKMINAIVKGGLLMGKILSLPAEFCKLELRILQEVSNKFVFDLCEHDTEVYSRLLRNVLENNILTTSIQRCEISEIIDKARQDEYSHLILDYCGNFNTHHLELDRAMTNKIVKVGGIIAMTFSQRDTNCFILNEMNRINPPKNGETRTFSAVKTFVDLVCEKIDANGSEKHYEVEKPFSYHDSSPMMLLIIKRIK